LKFIGPDVSGVFLDFFGGKQSFGVPACTFFNAIAERWIKTRSENGFLPARQKFFEDLADAALEG